MIVPGRNARPPLTALFPPTNDPVAGPTIDSIIGPIAGPIIGIDVGEDFLDLAMLDRAARVLRLARVPVFGINRARDRVANAPEDRGAIRELERRLLAAAPELDADGAVVLIDSPRWPRDLDLARRTAGAHSRRASAPTSNSRAIDTALRAIVREMALKTRDGTPFRLALFPTPRLDFFAACANAAGCKPHLAAIASELFGPALEAQPALPAPTGGRVFTRFMLTGFAVYRALDRTRSQTFEAYPDLAFRLWARGAELPPKGAGRAALGARKRINRRLAEEIGCAGAPNIATLDQADAAVLALSAGLAERAGVIAIIAQPGEGRFALALDRDPAGWSD